MRGEMWRRTLIAVALVGVCIGIWAAIGFGLVSLVNGIEDPDEVDHYIEIGWISDKNRTEMFDAGKKGRFNTYAWNLIDWSEDAKYVYGFADDPKDRSIGNYMGRRLGRFYLVLECDTLKFHQFMRLEDAPPQFRKKLARLQTDSRRRRQGPFIR